MVFSAHGLPTERTPAMRPRLLTLTALLTASLAYAGQLLLTEDEQDSCDSQDGCLIVTKEWMRAQLREAYKAGQEASTPCKGPSL